MGSLAGSGACGNCQAIPPTSQTGAMTMTEALSHLTRRAALGVSVGAMAAMACGRALAVGATQRRDLEAVFAENGVAGTFVLYDVAADQLTLIAAERAQTRLVPASTFKIANTIIALETGVVKDQNEVIPYGGRPQPFKTWEKDMSMREAIALSAVPIYQELARRIGLERYREWLARLDFGNRQTGTIVDTFWLDGPLEISAVEEARFAAALAQQKLEPRSAPSRLRATSFDLRVATAKSSTARPDGASPARQTSGGGPDGSNRMARFQRSH
jgi:beta-lactamase class D